MSPQLEACPSPSSVPGQGWWFAQHCWHTLAAAVQNLGDTSQGLLLPVAYCSHLCSVGALYRWVESCFPFPVWILMMSCQRNRWLWDFSGGVWGNPGGSCMSWFQKAIHVMTGRSLMQAVQWNACVVRCLDLPSALWIHRLNPGLCIFFSLRGSWHCQLAHMTDSFLLPSYL